MDTDGLGLAYVAGFFDGEGSVSIAMSAFKYRSSPCLTASICNTNLMVLECIQEDFGGKIELSNPGGRGNRKPTYVLRWHSWEAVNILHLLYPYLFIKTRHAEIGMEYQETFRLIWTKNGLPPEIREKRKAIASELQKLNQKGMVRE